MPLQAAFILDAAALLRQKGEINSFLSFGKGAPFREMYVTILINGKAERRLEFTSQSVIEALLISRLTQIEKELEAMGVEP